ncbi:MAG: PQQ-dependent sugar dehydrogenase [Pseudomonadales bacterium]|nr:PQQ-dependent sugar dehydrogenase [Pseudomonadales bacterium]
MTSIENGQNPLQTPLKRPVKWLRNIFIAVVLGAVLLWLMIRFMVGAVNFPLPVDTFDPAAVNDRLRVPDGFSIGIYAAGVDNARLLRFTRQGDLLVANTNLDRIILLHRDADKNGVADGQEVLLTGLNGPNGLDFYEDWLYIAESDAIGRVQFDHQAGAVIGEYQRIVTNLPVGGNHWRKTLRFGPDGMLYVSMGSSCNVCIEKDKRRGALVRYNPDGSGEQIFAAGLRNSAGFDWSPEDGLLYATDNGRDLLGDDFPPCEFNQIEEGKHYGWPYANGNRLSDPDFGSGNEDLIAASEPPVFDFRAHNAPLGMAFVRGKKFPEQYHGAAIVALHGSWNRSEKDGYKVVSLHWNASREEIQQRDFVSGFLNNQQNIGNQVIGRPADVTEGPDGAIYIADDYANVVYRVVYRVAYGEQQQAVSNNSLDAVMLDGLPVNDAAVEPARSNTEQSSVLSSRVKMSAEGEQIFRQFQCVGCHDDSGRGLKILTNLGDKYDLESIQKYLARPNPPMPMYPFDDHQRQALGIYLLGRYP